MAKKFELKVEPLPETENVMVAKVLYNGIDIYSEVFEKDEEKIRVLENWKKFIETSDGAIRTIAMDEENGAYTTLMFLKVLKDTDKYRYYRYSLNPYIEGYAVYDKETQEMLVLIEDPKDLVDEEIDKLIVGGKAYSVPILHIYK